MASMPEQRDGRGQLKVFLGYASGVGKTYQMLVEARQLKRDGVDIAIGYFEAHDREETIAQTEGLEFVPRKSYSHRGATFEDMDTDAVIARRPRVCVVDEFAHTNAPGSERQKRWQDVMVLLDAGIDVFTNLNVQHIESLNDQVFYVTGVRVRETIPDWVAKKADEVVLVDVTPRALQHRMERGVVYPPEQARKALENFFTEQNLTALRELAMRQTAYNLEERREEEGRREENASGEPKPVSAASRPVGEERILLWLTPQPSTAMLIRRGRRVADFLDSSCTAVYVANTEDLSDLPLDRRAAIERVLNFCHNLQIGAKVIAGQEPAKVVASYARENGITQIFVTRDTPDVHKLVQLVRDRQVTIVSARVRPAA